MLTRDLPELVAAAADVPVRLGVSIALLDRQLQAGWSRARPSPAARLDLVRRITDAGLPCGVMVAPVLPLLTDSAEALDALLGRIAAAGADRGDGARAAPAAGYPRVVPGLAGPGAPAAGRAVRPAVPARAPTSTRSTGGRWARRVAPLLRRHGLDGAGRALRDRIPAEPRAGAGGR